MFDFLGDIGTALAKPFRDATGISISPQSVSFGTPFKDFTLGDAAALGGGFASGFSPTSFADLGHFSLGNLAHNPFGLGDPSKWTLGSVPGLLGRLGAAGIGGQGASASFGASPSMGQGAYQSSLSNAYNAYSPAGRENTVTSYQGQANRRAKMQGRKSAQMLASRGYGSGAQQGAMIGAQNAANEATNEFAQRVYDPASVAAGYANQARFMAPQSWNAYDAFNANLQGQQYANERNRPLSQTEQLLEWAKSNLPVIFGRTGGSKGGNNPPVASWGRQGDNPFILSYTPDRWKSAFDVGGLQFGPGSSNNPGFTPPYNPNRGKSAFDVGGLQF